MPALPSLCPLNTPIGVVQREKERGSSPFGQTHGCHENSNQLPLISLLLLHLLPTDTSLTDNKPKQVSELAEEGELRDLFERFGRVTRVFLARDRETQRAKGFAFISFADRSDAARACEKMDGCKLSLPISIFRHILFLFFPPSLQCQQQSKLSESQLIFPLHLVGYRHLILRVEFAKRAT